MASFVESMGFPPSRLEDHRIMLLPGSIPPNIRPYRYLFHHKTVIETLFHDLLKQGVIRPSTSSFSSPVLLVEEKNGSWCLCIDMMSLFYENSFDSCVIFNIIIQQWFSFGMVGFTMLLKMLVVVFFYLVFYYSFIPLVSSSNTYNIQNSRADF